MIVLRREAPGGWPEVAERGPAAQEGPPAAPPEQPCEDIELLIPAFVDEERDQGLVAAAQALPAVWWHILTCPGCDELYRALKELAVIERS